MGFSEDLETVFQQDFNLTVADAANAVQQIRTRTERYICDAAMPIQDAIDLASYLATVAKGWSRFNLGANSVGGPTDIAVLTTHQGFKWVARKHYYDPELNP